MTFAIINRGNLALPTNKSHKMTFVLAGCLPMRWACGTQCFEAEFQSGKMSINTFISVASLLGFEGVEIDERHLPSTRPSYAQILRERLAEHEVVPAIINLNAATAEELIPKAEQVMSFARELRARAVCLVGPEDWAVFADALKSLSELSEHLSLPIGLSLPTKVGAAKPLCDLLDDIASPYLGVCMEVFSEITPQSEFWQDLVRVAPFTLHVHLHVTDLAKSLTWLPVLELLREVEYNGFLSIVRTPEPAEESLRVLSSQLSLIAR